MPSLGDRGHGHTSAATTGRPDDNTGHVRANKVCQIKSSPTDSCQVKSSKVCQIKSSPTDSCQVKSSICLVRLNENVDANTHSVNTSPLGVCLHSSTSRLDGLKGSMTNSMATCLTWRGMGSVRLYLVHDTSHDENKELYHTRLVATRINKDHAFHCTPGWRCQVCYWCIIEDSLKRQHHTGTWNTSTLRTAEKLQELTHEMDRYRRNILGLCEMRWKNACESWILTAELQRRIQATEMWCYQKILCISHKNHVTNEKVRANIQQAIGPPSPRGLWRTGKNGGNWLWNHLLCPSFPCG